MPRLIATIDRVDATQDRKSFAWRETRSFAGTATISDVWKWATEREPAQRMLNVRLTFDQAEESTD